MAENCSPYLSVDEHCLPRRGSNSSREVTGEDKIVDIRLRLETSEDYTDDRLRQDDVVRFAKMMLPQILKIERRVQTRNLAQAIDVIRNFSLMRGLDQDAAPWINLASIVGSATAEATDESGSYPTMRQAFSRVTKHFSIGTDTWKAIAMPLHVAYTLERAAQTREAMKIAAEVVRAEIARA